MSPADQVPSLERLRQMPVAELEDLAAELRRRILVTCQANGGHLGASLGAVELAIALHAVFESPRDALIWDVGHQAYAHKLLTGRAERFQTLRMEGGLSGFLSRDESPHDRFGAGHSSTSLSAALGMAWEAGRQARPPGELVPWTVAIVGDGGLTAGLAFEALNNICETRNGPLLVLLNDNEMSISPNRGALARLLRDARAGEFFRGFGLRYEGPVDGHDLGALLPALRRIREQPGAGPVLLHARTRKGKGHGPAEAQPVAFHGVSPSGSSRRTFSETAGDTLARIAAADARVVAISAAMVDGTGLQPLRAQLPERVFDVGIAEAHAVTFAAGLAASGARPVVCIYSTFLQRGLDGIIHDVALQRLPVVFLVDRAGVVGPDGPTHHGAFDLAYFGMIPGIRVSAPSSLADLEMLIERALGHADGPWAVRYPRGGGPQALEPAPDPAGIRWHRVAPNPQVIAVALGTAAERIARAATACDPRAETITAVSCIHARPLPEALLEYLCRHPGAALLVAEEGVVRGGFGEGLLAAAQGRMPRSGKVDLAGYGDHFIRQASPDRQEEWEGLSQGALERRLRTLLGTAS